MRALLLLCALLLLAAPRGLAAQQTAAPGIPLEQFVRQVAWLWNIGDVAALVDLLPEGQRVVLDTGSGTESVSSHHAGAALRALFEGRESVATRPVRVALAGGSPPRGFGELAWSFRMRGGPTAQARSVYVGAAWQGTAWRISELRVLP